MKPRYSAVYLDRLFSSDEYGDLAQLSSILCATDCSRRVKTIIACRNPCLSSRNASTGLQWRGDLAVRGPTTRRLRGADRRPCAKASKSSQSQSWHVAMHKEWT